LGTTPAPAYSKHITIGIVRDANSTDAADDGVEVVGSREEFGAVEEFGACKRT
jgi:hypothetical protein